MRTLLLATDPKVIDAFKPLVGWGHRVWVCSTPDQAQKHLARNNVNLLLVDPGLEAADAGVGWAGVLGGKVPGVLLTPHPQEVILPKGVLLALPRPPGLVDLQGMVRQVAPGVEPPAFNQPAALRICDGDAGLLTEISQVFLGDAPNQIETICRGLEQDDLSQVQKGAHSLKGAAGNLAAGPLRDAAQELEEAGRRRDAPRARAVFAQVQYQFHRLKKFLARDPGYSP